MQDVLLTILAQIPAGEAPKEGSGGFGVYPVRDIMLILGTIGTVVSAFLLWVFGKLRSEPQHKEIVELVQNSNKEILENSQKAASEQIQILKGSYERESQYLQERLSEVKAELTKVRQELEKMHDEYTQTLKENGELKAKVARLEVEVEFLRVSRGQERAAG